MAVPLFDRLVLNRAPARPSTERRERLASGTMLGTELLRISFALWFP